MIDPDTYAGLLAGGNDLIAVVEHHLLRYGSLVSSFLVVFHNNILQYDIDFIIYYSENKFPQ